MALQTAANVLVAARREVTVGAQATATGAYQLRIIDSPGLVLNRAPIQSQEKRSDSTTPMSRLGGKSVQGSFNCELSVGGAHNLFIEALMRGAWATSVAIGFASVSSVTCGTNEVVGGGDWVAQGVRVGDIFRLSGYSTAANNDQNLRVTAVSSGTISVPAGSLTAGSADSTGTLTILRKLVNPSTPIRYSHTIEQYDSDVDLSELFFGCRVVGARFSFRPNQMATVQYTLMGLDADTLATGTSPYFTSPTLTTGLSLIADDSLILKDGVAVTKFTGFDLDMQIQAGLQPVIGSLTSPDVFDNNLIVSGTISGLREDFTLIEQYQAETEFSISIMLEEPVSSGASPVLGIYIPRVKFSSAEAPVGGGDGAKIQTFGLMVGPKAAETGHDASTVIFHTDAT